MIQNGEKKFDRKRRGNKNSRMGIRERPSTKKKLARAGMMATTRFRGQKKKQESGVTRDSTRSFERLPESKLMTKPDAPGKPAGRIDGLTKEGICHLAHKGAWGARIKTRVHVLRTQREGIAAAVSA